MRVETKASKKVLKQEHKKAGVPFLTAAPHTLLNVVVGVVGVDPVSDQQRADNLGVAKLG